MRRKLFRMISPSSLSAFSQSIAQGGISTGSVHRATRAAEAMQQKQPGMKQAGAKDVAPPPAPVIGPAPSRMLPRGSLLNQLA